MVSEHGRPEADRLDTAIERTTERVDQLHADDRFNQRWHREYPDHAQRIYQLEQALDDLDAAPALPAADDRPAVTAPQRQHGHESDLDVDHQPNAATTCLDQFHHRPPPEREPPGATAGLEM